MKRLSALILILALLLCSCGGGSTAESGSEPADNPVPDGVFSEFDLDTSEGPAPVTVAFNGKEANITGEGAAVSDGVLTIDRAGAYVLSGDFTGTVAVAAAKEDDVHLILNGVTITSDSAAINGISSDKIVITLADGTENTLTDGKSYFVNKGDEPNACIFSDDDMTLNGDGTLTVNGNCNNGIGSKNDLRIVSGNITVNAPKNALKGNDSVLIGGGNINLTAGKDAIKSDNEEEAERGYVSILGGEIVIDAGDDGIQATHLITVKGGKVTVHASDNALNCDGRIDADSKRIVEK